MTITDDALLFAIETDYICELYRGLIDEDGRVRCFAARNCPFRDYNICGERDTVLLRELAATRGIDLTHLEEGL
jgi:hypothetical protein